MQTPERKYGGEIDQRKEEFEVPKNLKKTGIEGVETAFKARVKQGKQNLVQSPANTKVDVNIPKTKPILDEGAKGSAVDSYTWFSKFWIRTLKRALYFGKNVIFGKEKSK